MKDKSKIILLFSFVIVLIGVVIITNLDSNKINYYNLVENLENIDGSLNNLSKSNCNSKCIINYNNCITDNSGILKCNWSNINTNIFLNSDISNCNSCQQINNITYDMCNNIYNFNYNNKSIKLSEGFYMDLSGNVKQFNINNIDNKTDNNIYNDISSNILENSLNNIELCLSSRLSNKLLINLSNLFKNNIDSLLNPRVNNRNVGSNLNTSAHLNNLKYMNLNSSNENLANANSNHNLIRDDPFSRQQQCYHKSSGKEIQCPESYNYKPRMSYR